MGFSKATQVDDQGSEEPDMISHLLGHVFTVSDGEGEHLGTHKDS